MKLWLIDCRILFNLVVHEGWDSVCGLAEGGNEANGLPLVVYYYHYFITIIIIIIIIILLLYYYYYYCYYYYYY